MKTEDSEKRAVVEALKAEIQTTILLTVCGQQQGNDDDAPKFMLRFYSWFY